MTIPNHHLSMRDGAHGGARPLILIVDDSNVVRSISRVIFQNDFEVHEASDGAKAIEILRKGEHNYSAILLDLVMQGVDGWEVLKFLRESGIVKTVPVVVETASAIDLQTVTELYECGAWEVIAKPFDGKMLLALMKAVCERANAAAAAIAAAGGELNDVLEGTAAAVFAGSSTPSSREPPPPSSRSTPLRGRSCAPTAASTRWSATRGRSASRLRTSWGRTPSSSTGSSGTRLIPVPEAPSWSNRSSPTTWTCFSAS